MPLRLPSPVSSRSSSHRSGGNDRREIVYPPQAFRTQYRPADDEPRQRNHDSLHYRPLNAPSRRSSSEYLSRPRTLSVENYVPSRRESYSSADRNHRYPESRSSQSHLSGSAARSSYTFTNSGSAGSRRGTHGSQTDSSQSRTGGPRAYYFTPSNQTADITYSGHHLPSDLTPYQSSILSISDHSSGSRRSRLSDPSSHGQPRQRSRGPSQHDVEYRYSPQSSHRSHYSRR